MGRDEGKGELGGVRRLREGRERGVCAEVSGWKGAARRKVELVEEALRGGDGAVVNRRRSRSARVCVGSGTSGGANRARAAAGRSGMGSGGVRRQACEEMRARGSLAACGGCAKEGSAGCARRFRAGRALREGRAATAKARIAGGMPSAPAAEPSGCRRLR
jgi:hypothetical protein